jgi:Zn-finger protein
MPFNYFRNDDCEFFPCHAGIGFDDFNCLFCFCPLFFVGNCGGEYTLLDGGWKDCSLCTLNHRRENYQLVIDTLKQIHPEYMRILPNVDSE